jgi:uncharacterized protein with PIN domain
MPRFAELERLEVIKSIGTKTCSVTGREVLVWDVTKSVQKKPKTKEHKEKCPYCNGKGYTVQLTMDL